MTTLYFLIAISGVPNKDFTFFRNLKPRLQSSLLTVFSNWVWDRMDFIILLRASLDIVSAIGFPPLSPRLYPIPLLLYQQHNGCMLVMNEIILFVYDRAQKMLQ
jgi:hypothetical protein